MSGFRLLLIEDDETLRGFSTMRSSATATGPSARTGMALSGSIAWWRRLVHT